MNIYRVGFARPCPVNGTSIQYKLVVKTTRTLSAEELADFCSDDRAVLHEHLADELLSEFGGKQTLDALHGAVEISTERGSI